MAASPWPSRCPRRSFRSSRPSSSSPWQGRPRFACAPESPDQPPHRDRRPATRPHAHPHAHQGSTNMAEWLVSVLSWTFLMQVVRVTIPYALAAMGGVVSERSGVVNIALEGILLMGAFGAAVGAYDSGGSIFIALIYGVGAGVATAALYALAVVTFRADQIVAGVAINMLAYGVTPYLLKA